MKIFKLFFIFFFCNISCAERQKLQKAPDFTLKTIYEDEFHLYDYIGNVIIIDFWDTWCPPCRAEIPHFIELYEKYGDKGLLIVGIAFAREGIEKVKSFANEKGINYPVLIATTEVVKDYGGITAIPTTFILDKKGRIFEKVIGYRNKEFFEEKIKNLLK